LNRAHMGHDGPTDVLSFPLDGGDDLAPNGHSKADDDAQIDTPPMLLGDIVICPQVAMTQAAEHCGDADTELTLLVVHGVLHILGHDHAEPEEEAVMIEREAAHLQRYGLIHPGPVRPESDRS
ncbi:MAG: rRNA maturation RNase YbeY, partial [Acidimicrobiia bacterium]|nr:rRNA maturation RNase YbeY [Acidimicrobiia bacterium]